MSGSVGGNVGIEPRYGTSLSNRSSSLPSPNSFAADCACGLVSFIWPSSAAVINIGEKPPISLQICFQVHPFSRLMSRIFSVRSARFIIVSVRCLAGPTRSRDRGPFSRHCGADVAFRRLSAKPLFLALELQAQGSVTTRARGRRNRSQDDRDDEPDALSRSRTTR